MSDNGYWLGFSLIPGIGPKRIIQLRDYFGDIASAWLASESDLRQFGFSERLCHTFLDHRQRLNLAQEVEKVTRMNVSLITLGDDKYPASLREIDDPPPVLYVRGSMVEQDRRSLAVVGTRKPTRYGHDAAHDLSYRLASQGVTIISGLALGIDSAAHRGAIEGGGRTIAVLGCGIDMVYPRENYALAQQVSTCGAVLSEFSLGTRPLAGNFPRRNRILSGLALGVLVVEAPESSGALITASQAAEQGREVFAVPANIYNQTGQGCNRLLQDGAKLVMSEKDVLEELDIAYEHTRIRDVAEEIVATDVVEDKILALLDTEPIHVDDLVRLSGLSTAEVTSTLTLLELKGLAKSAGHMQYCRTYSPR